MGDQLEVFRARFGWEEDNPEIAALYFYRIFGTKAASFCVFRTPSSLRLASIPDAEYPEPEPGLLLHTMQKIDTDVSLGVFPFILLKRPLLIAKVTRGSYHMMRTCTYGEQKDTDGVISLYYKA